MLLRKITDLVDRDVAANSKPISMIGVVIPFVPFMIFADGAPLDRHPVTGSLAFVVSITWLLFVTWRMFRHVREGVEAYGYRIGSYRFWRLIAGPALLIALFAAVITWLQNKLG